MHSNQLNRSYTTGYDPVTDTSLVHCQPLTGRSHQIRVHLQHIGHPIWDDSRYNQGYMLKQKRTQQTMHATTTDGTGTVSASQASVFSSTSPSSTTAHVLDPFCPSCRGDEYTKYQSYLDCIERDRRDATSNNNSTSCKETKDINAADINIDEEIESFMRVADLEEAISLHALRYDIVKQSSSSNSSEKVDRKNGDGARCKETEELINERMGIDMNAIDGSNEDGELTSFQVPWPAWAKIFTRFSSFSGQDLMRSRK